MSKFSRSSRLQLYKKKYIHIIINILHIQNLMSKNIFVLYLLMVLVPTLVIFFEFNRNLIILFAILIHKNYTQLLIYKIIYYIIYLILILIKNAVRKLNIFQICSYKF